jgi:hypothetical protein
MAGVTIKDTDKGYKRLVKEVFEGKKATRHRRHSRTRGRAT